jgi:hypothetical protein
MTTDSSMISIKHIIIILQKRPQPYFNIANITILMTINYDIFKFSIFC